MDGKFFRLGAAKFYVKGVTYGPFAPDAEGQFFASQEQTARDFDQIRSLGARIWCGFITCHRLGCSTWPWVKSCESWSISLGAGIARGSIQPRRARKRAKPVRQAAIACASHPAVFALSVVNEIPADIVRWSEPEQAAAFINELIRCLVKAIDPECPCTFGNYPPTEFLRPLNC